MERVSLNWRQVLQCKTLFRSNASHLVLLRINRTIKCSSERFYLCCTLLQENSLEKFETVRPLWVTTVQSFPNTFHISTVSVDYSSIERPMINFVQLIEVVVTDGVRHWFSNCLKDLFLMC